MPKSAICDPLLTLGLPPLLTAATGMDAVAHCMETFMASPFNPPADGIALDGLERAWANIEKACSNGQDQDARLNMMSASMQGAMAFQKGLGCVHSLSHSLGGINPKLHHGTLNAIFLPSVVKFNQEASSVIQDNRIFRMARAMGLNSASDIIPALVEMNKKLGLPSGLKELGVHQEMFPKIIDGALKDHCHLMNPRLASVEDYKNILNESM
jgi:alcohol dehydrogenase class IV